MPSSFLPCWSRHMHFVFSSGEHELSLVGTHAKSLLPTGFWNVHSVRELAFPRNPSAFTPSPPAPPASAPTPSSSKGLPSLQQRAIVTCKRRSRRSPPHLAPPCAFVFWFMHSRPGRFCPLWWLWVQSCHHWDILISSALVISELLFLSGNT